MQKFTRYRIIVLSKGSVVVWLRGGLYDIERYGKHVKTVTSYNEALNYLWENT